MFKLAAITDEVSQDFAHALDVCKEYGCEGAEVRSVWDIPVGKLTDQHLRDMQKMLDDRGMRVCCVASPFLKCELGDAQAYREHLELLRRCIDIGHQFGANLIRGFAFWKKGPLEPVWQQILDAFPQPLEILREMDAVLGIENEASCYLGTGSEVGRFLKHFDDPHLAAVWDPANQVFANPDEPPYPTGYEAVRGRMAHCHVKDARWNKAEGKAACTPIGEGDIDYPGQIRALLRDGYQGYLSLETHWRPEGLTEEQLSRPGGTAFSSTGEYGSRICLENLTRIINEARANA